MIRDEKPILQAASEKYRYDKETGDFYYMKSPKKSRVGTKCTSTDSYGYKVLSLSFEGKRRTIKAHRLAWFITHGVPPKNVINHINHERGDNQITNLEDVTTRKNTDQKHLTSASQYVGVKLVSKPWMAAIVVAGRREHLGCFKTEEEASIAYQKRLKEVEHVG